MISQSTISIKSVILGCEMILQSMVYVILAGSLGGAPAISGRHADAALWVD